MKYIRLILIGLISVMFVSCAKNPYSSAWKGDVQGMHESFNKGWDVNGRGPDGVLPKSTPLATAVAFGQYEIVKLLIDKGADLQTNRNKLKRGCTAWGSSTNKNYGLLAMAIAVRDKRIVEILIDNDVPYDIDYTGFCTSPAKKNEQATRNMQKYAIKYYKEVEIRKKQIKQEKVQSNKNDSVDALLGI